MKWTNPGHQLDELGERYLKVKNVYIYGIDERAKKAYDFLQWLGVVDEFNISFVLDITVLNKESNHIFCGKRIIAFQTDLCPELRGAPEESVVALPWIAQSNEREILEKIGLVNIFYLTPSHNRCDNFVQNFVCVWLMYRHGKLLSHWTNFVTTLKCNLNCKYCLNFNELLVNPKDVSFEEFKEHVDVIFSKFDYLYSLHFTGGEPILVKELPKFIRYIQENYKDRIFEFFIITNGTVMPNKELISAVKSLNGSFLVDDYSLSVPNTKVEEIKNILTEHDVCYAINNVQCWYDLDVENTNNSDLSEEELENYKDNCNSALHEFADKRIYACCYQQYASRAGIGISTSSNDYIELASTSKMEILEFRQGYTHKGHIDFCKRCRGIGANVKVVAAAMQISKTPKNKEQVQTRSDDKMKDLVSICVPIYNTEKYLTRCVNSLLNQTYRNLEIVLVNDGSTDSCCLICEGYAKLDSRVVVVHKENGGEASARNAGLRAAKGDYVMFIDSDDEYLPNAVELMIAAKSDDVDLVIGGYLERRGEIEHFATGHLRHYSAKEIALVYLSSACQYDMPYIATTINAKLFRHDIISCNSISFDERFVVGNDAVFMCDYLKHTRAVHDVFAPIYVYYKFHPSERVQGMGWYYPDTFFLFAYVADRMIKIVHPDEIEFKRLIIKQYKDLLYALVNATANREHFKTGLIPYLNSLCDEIDLLQIGARLDLAEDFIKKEDGALPIRLISYLIVNKRYTELYKMLQALGKARKIIPYKGERVRQMIRLNLDGSENTREPRSVGNIPSDEAQRSGNFSFADDKLLVEQVNELVTIITANQRQIDAYEVKNSLLENTYNELVKSDTQLQNTYNELVKSDAQLQNTYNELVKSDTQLRMQYDKIYHSPFFKLDRILQRHRLIRFILRFGFRIARIPFKILRINRS
jgi:glycosyltransferase involved in cell wall biosynthesis/organic radical activating enzyme